jgi:predicted metallo-beta-lactamase superfamily hydrolase
MKVRIIAADSMGVRSMATVVETEDVKIFIDPSAALGPVRYGLPPHPLEEKALEDSWKQIVKESDADVVVISHYHYDHHNPETHLEEIYGGKQVFLKHPTENINKSQRQRAAYFLEKIKPLAKTIEFCDGKAVKFGKTEIVFSPAVPHGINARLGYVVETFVTDGSNSFIHTSDVEGPALEEQKTFILKYKPEVVFIDGPLTYQMQRYGRRNLEKAIENLEEISKHSEIVIDHHLLRELKWREHLGKMGEKVKNAAQFMRKPERLLEARRKELWKKEKIST